MLAPDTESSRLPPLPYRRWIELAAVALVLGFIAALLIPAVLTARTTARRTHAANNLRNLVISMHAFATSKNGGLPSGGRVAANGDANLGWCLAVWPYVESSSLYSNVDEQAVPWDDPATQRWLKQPMAILQSPLIDKRATLDGWPLIHFSANPDLFYQNSLARMTDPESTADCWLLGEVSDRLVPWAYPFNWREPGNSAGKPSSAFRNPLGTCQFAMADGRVVQIAADGSALFLKTSARSTADHRRRTERETPFARFVPPRTF